MPKQRKFTDDEDHVDLQGDFDILFYDPQTNSVLVVGHWGSTRNIKGLEEFPNHSARGDFRKARHQYAVFELPQRVALEKYLSTSDSRVKIMPQVQGRPETIQDCFRSSRSEIFLGMDFYAWFSDHARADLARKAN
jgi:hypothetical protein